MKCFNGWVRRMGTMGGLASTSTSPACPMGESSHAFGICGFIVRVGMGAHGKYGSKLLI